jgi:hypothetical protein
MEQAIYIAFSDITYTAELIHRARVKAINLEFKGRRCKTSTILSM